MIVAGCTNIPEVPTATAVNPTAGASAAPAPTASPTDTPTATLAPAATITPEPAPTALPTIAGRTARWTRLSMPSGMVANTETEAWNLVFSWSRGYLVFHGVASKAGITPWVSSDGAAWTKGRPMDVAGLTQGAWIEKIAESPAGLLALGFTPGCADDGTGCVPAPAIAAWTSTDGLAWTRLYLGPAFGSGQVGDVAGGPKGFMAVSSDAASTTTAPSVWFSTDGRDWHGGPLTAPVFANASLAAGLALEGGFVLEGRVGSLDGFGGGSFPATTPALWWSSDGSAWSVVKLAGSAAAPEAEARIVPVGAGKLVAHVVGWDTPSQPDGQGMAWTSADGRTWKLSAAPFPAAPTTIETDGRQAVQVVVRVDGALAMAVSADGFAWLEVPSTGTGAGPSDFSDYVMGPAGLLVEDVEGTLWLATESSAGG
jgi:hypothetical protein